MTLTHLIVLLLVGAVAGLIAERLVSRGMPGGLLGAIVAGLVGAWLMVDVLHLVIAPELSLGVSRFSRRSLVRPSWSCCSASWRAEASLAVGAAASSRS